MESHGTKRKSFLDASSLEWIDRLLETVYRLRAPGGCPWDRKQTPQSLRTYLLEETYEVLDVLDRFDSTHAWADLNLRSSLKEELGDLLLQIALHSEIAKESGAFDFASVAQGLNEKLIRRHPHVFGETVVENADQVVQNWEKLKKEEKSDGAGSEKRSVLEGILKNFPALTRAQKTIEKVSSVGFQWPNLEGPLQKLEEETKELKEALQSQETQRIEEEIGDLLFSVCNIAHFAKVRPEDALRSFLNRFENRFKFLESEILKTGKKLEDTSLEEMDRYWDLAKKQEKKARPNG